ncbi:hypothetical protein OTK49_01835 [Vibrio coralliirubri]|uniref:hypothetical protein n=1 Tax=Vibrio coralliirubri TaxID=1516159 RepID=UPI0022837C72|nr:hypothetical protein [Vibrio coralliirubri]MCY9861254.1 hypothetical protein [Vibrio coralliirubri]
MAFKFVCTKTNKSFVIALRDSGILQRIFAEGYSSAKLASFASSDINFHESFFEDKPSSHSLIIDIAVNGRCVFNVEDLPVINEAIANLEGNNLSEHPLYGLLQTAKQQVDESGMCVFSEEVVSSVSED